MSFGKLTQSIGFILHLSVGVFVVLWLTDKADAREASLEHHRARLAEDRKELEERRSYLDMQRERLNGLDHKDPYVVELIARERHGYQAMDETRPPPISP